MMKEPLELISPFKGILAHVKQVKSYHFKPSSINIPDTVKVGNILIKFLEESNLHAYKEYDDFSIIKNSKLVSKNWYHFTKWLRKQKL